MQLARYRFAASFLYILILAASTFTVFSPSSSVAFSVNIGKEESVCPGGCGVRGGSSGSNYRLDPAAAARAARERKAIQLNEAAIALKGPENRARQIQLLKEAAQLWPNSSVILSNFAEKRSYWAWERGNYSEALRYIREALRYDPRNQINLSNLAQLEARLAYDSGQLSRAVAKMREAINYSSSEDRLDTLREWQREADNAEREEREAKAARTSIQKNVTDLAKLLQRDPDSGGTVPGRQGTRIFGRDANPPGLQFMPAAPDPGVINKNTFEQASSVAKDGSAAKNAPSNEQAKYQAGCGTAGLACQKGDPAPTITLKGVPRGSAWLPADIRTEMLRDERGKGKQLIDTENDARAKEALAKTALDVMDKALAAATDADKQTLATIRSDFYQDWSNKKSNLEAAIVAVEDEAKNHYHVDMTEQPAGTAEAGASPPDKKTSGDR